MSEEARGWQPIDTAPRDGAWFVALQDGDTYPCKWVCEEPDEGHPIEGWYDYINGTFEEPTHWMISPPSPSPWPSEAQCWAAQRAILICRGIDPDEIIDGATLTRLRAYGFVEGRAALLAASPPVAVLPDEWRKGLIPPGFIMHGPHLDGYRVIAGFQTVDQAAEFHEWLTKLLPSPPKTQGGGE